MPVLVFKLFALAEIFGGSRVIAVSSGYLYSYWAFAGWECCKAKTPLFSNYLHWRENLQIICTESQGLLLADVALKTH